MSHTIQHAGSIQAAPQTGQARSTRRAASAPMMSTSVWCQSVEERGADEQSGVGGVIKVGAPPLPGVFQLHIGAGDAAERRHDFDDEGNVRRRGAVVGAAPGEVLEAEQPLEMPVDQGTPRLGVGGGEHLANLAHRHAEVAQPADHLGRGHLRGGVVAVAGVRVDLGGLE
jgi:hypothetical protein